jgi:cellulose biosynthesis protein BcsQ
MSVRRDVQGLARWVGPSALGYREIADLDRCRGAALQRGLVASAEPCSTALSSPCSAIALVSWAGRVGRTTLAAHLCAALAARGVRAMAVDLDPKGELRRALAPEHPCLTPSLDEILRLHRGALARGGRDPKSLAQELAAGSEVVVLDTGSEPTPALELAEAAAEVLLLVVTPEALNAAPRAMDRMAGGAGGLPRPFLLMNGFDNRREDHRGAFAALRGAYGERVLPDPVHFDPAFRERFGGAPHSQAASDMENLARWVQGPQEPCRK